MSKAIYRLNKNNVLHIKKLISYASNPERDYTLDHYNLAIVNNVRIRLTPRELVSLRFYYVDELGMADIAVEMGINVSTVSRNIKRGTGKVQQIFSLAKEISPIKF